MDGLSYTMIIGFAEPLARMSRRLVASKQREDGSGAKTDRRGSALDR